MILIHGLEGSSESSYMRGMAQASLEAGYAAHRVNLRGCGTANASSSYMYHAGLTADIEAILERLEREARGPVFLIGYSLGGNVALRLAGKMGVRATRWLAGVCGVSTPIDLEACVRRIGHRGNRFYQWWFVRSMRRSIQRRQQLAPERFTLPPMGRMRTVFDFDDQVTAPHFGFSGAGEYYQTQSAARVLDSIAVPTLLVQAADDPLVPIEMFRHPAIEANPNIRLITTPRGGHLGFLPRLGRSWVDRQLLNWMQQVGKQIAREAVV